MTPYFRSIPLLLVLLCAAFSPAQSSKHEVRAVWISSAGGDWPTSTDPAEQQRSLLAIFNTLQEQHFNTVFFQVRPRGNVLYRSALEPWASQLTGVLGRDPGYDPLEFAIAEAHKRGLELHAWFNVAKVWGSDNLPAHQQHVTRRHREWVRLFEGEWWLDMGEPDARAYTEALVKELVSSYDIDGIHFDYIRYPSPSFEDWGSFTKWGDGVERPEWRRNNITAFVRNVYAFVQKEKPWVKVGSAPLGIYQSIPGAQSSFNGYSGVFQDSRRWLREGIHDYLTPQLYWTIGEQKNPNDPDFYQLSSDWVNENAQRHIYIGIGAYRDAVQEEVKEQVRLTREEGAQGQAFFRYENVAAVIEQNGPLYTAPALVPPMAWKDSIPPNAPKEITVTKEKGTAVITWKEPDAAQDREPVHRYVVYRSMQKKIDTRRAENIAAVVPAPQRLYRDESSDGREYFYTVMSLDRAGNESGAPVTTVSELQRILTRYERPRRAVTVWNTVPAPMTGRSYIMFDLPARMPVRLSLSGPSAGTPTMLVNDTRTAGLHVVAVDLAAFPAGAIEYRLSAGDSTIVRTIVKP
ncbi:MAG: family 10 glycosylhydrolase [Bacteroidetes bacterium]|nr:family 10 glycosylhydrolase [Bacteroidota bacterium]